MENIKKVSGFQKILRSKAFTLFLLIVFLIILFTVLAPMNDARFFTQNTFISILRDLAVPAFLAIGAGCLMVSGGLDLSQSAVGAMAGVFIAVGLAWWKLPVPVVVIGALVLAGVIGLVNAILVNQLNFQPFIATMAMASIVRAITMLLSTDKNGQVQGTVNFSDSTLNDIINVQVGPIPATIFLMVAAFIIYGLILSKTKFGRKLYLVGGNPTAARLSGINSKKLSFMLFINCALLGGLAGVMYTSRVGQGASTALATDQFTGMTASILGGVSFGGGSGGMGGVFIALCAIKLFNKGMTIVGASSYLTNVLSGALLLGALSLDYYSQKRQQKRVGA